MKCQHCGEEHSDSVPPCKLAQMVADAAEAVDLFSEDELEAYAEKQRKERARRES